MSYYILDDYGCVRPVTYDHWLEWYSTVDRKIAQYHGKKFWVSTIFLGSGYAFETMVFHKGNWREWRMWRAGSWSEALENHAKGVDIVDELDKQLEKGRRNRLQRFKRKRGRR